MQRGQRPSGIPAATEHSKDRRDSFLQPTEDEMKSPTENDNLLPLNAKPSVFPWQENSMASFDPPKQSLGDSFDSKTSHPEDATEVRLFRTGSFDLSLETKDPSNPSSPTRIVNVSVHHGDNPSKAMDFFALSDGRSTDASTKQSQISRIVNDITTGMNSPPKNLRDQDSEWSDTVLNKRGAGEKSANHASERNSVPRLFVNQPPRPPSPLIHEDPLRNPIQSRLNGYEYSVASRTERDSGVAVKGTGLSSHTAPSQRTQVLSSRNYGVASSDHNPSYATHKYRFPSSKGGTPSSQSKCDSVPNTHSLNQNEKFPFQTSNASKWSDNGYLYRASHATVSPPQQAAHARPSQSFSTSARSKPSSAVVSAMKALQERVLMLETEREALVEKSEELEEKLREQSRENDHLTREAHVQLEESSKRLHTNSERSQEQISQLQQKVQELQQELDMMRERVLESNSVKLDAENEVSCLEQYIKELKQQMAKGDENLRTRGIAIESLREQKQNIQNEHNSLQKRLTSALDHADTLTELNSKLLSRLSLYEDINVQDNSSKQRRRIGKRKSNITRPTASVLGKQRPTRVSKGKQANRKPKVLNRVPAHHQAKELYITHQEQLSLHQELLNANNSHPVPFITASSPGRNNSFSVYANTQHHLADVASFGQSNTNASHQDYEHPDAKVSLSSTKMENVLDALETELRALHERLAHMDQVQEAGRGSNRDPITSCVVSRNTDDDDEESASKLSRMEIVNQIRTKQEQLLALKRFRRGMDVGSSKAIRSPDIRPRSPVKRPEAFERRVRAMRLLNELRKEE